MKDFLDVVWGQLGPGRLGELRLFRGEDRYQKWVQSTEVAEKVSREAMTMADVYFGVLPRTRKEGGGDAIDDVTSILWADFDAKTLSNRNPLGMKEGAFMALQSVAPQPQIIVDSGNGYHGYWLLKDEVAFDEARQVMKGFQILAGADKTFDKARILRVPGTLNHKSDPPLPVRTLRFDLLARRHRISDFVDYASAAMPQRQERTAYRDEYEGVEVEGWEVSHPKSPKFPEGQRNNGLASLAGIMYARGMTQDQVTEALLSENFIRCDPPLDQHEVEMIAWSIGRLHG